MKTILITADQIVSIREISGFSALCEYYKGFPETVNPRRLDRPFCMIVDDAGKLHGLSVNLFGSWLYQAEIHGALIVGDVFLMKQVWNKDGYDLVGLDDNDIDQLLKKYGLKPV